MPRSPEQLDSEPEPEAIIESHAEAAEKLEKKFAKKTLSEKVVSEYYTKESEIRGGGVERGESTRFERGQLFKAYKILRTEIKEAEERGEDAVKNRALLKEIRNRAKVMERNLDELERQMKENIRIVDVETELGKFSMPVTELDLKKEAEAEKDERTPYIFWGGINSNVEMNGCIVMALALAGQRVIGIPHLEQQNVKKPVSAGEIFRQQRNFKTHAELTKGVIEKLGLQKYSLIGYSTGASITLEAAIELSSDPELKGRLEDLIAIEPVGLEKQGVENLAAGLGANFVRELPSSEARIKIFQGGRTNRQEQKLPVEIEAVLTLAEKQFTPERLSQIEAAGSFQWWVGRASGLTNLPLTERVVGKMQKLMKERDADAHTPQLNEVQGATHFLPIMNALGLARMIVEEGQTASGQPRIIKRKDLENSAVAGILRDVKLSKAEK